MNNKMHTPSKHSPAARKQEVSLSDPRACRDRRADWLSYFDKCKLKWAREHLARNPQIIDEYRDNPLSLKGPQSSELELLLNYFRTHPVLGRYFVYATKPWSEYQIATLSKRGQKPQILPGNTYATEMEAGFGILLERIRYLQEDAA